MTDTFNKDANSAYYAVITKNHIENTEDGRLLFRRGWYLGAQYAMHTSGELSPHLARFMEFVMWLTERSDEIPQDTEARESDNDHG